VGWLTEKLLDFNVEKTVEKICFLLRRFVEDSGVEGVVIGVSGGLDSTTTTYLCVKALGPDKVITVFMPETETFNPKDADDVKLFTKSLGVKLYEVNISNPVKSLMETIPVSDPKDFKVNGNLKVRVRMVTLYYFANKFNRLVAGTSNKSEVLTGYYTKWGDGASDVLPIGSLYKTQVKKLANYIGVPRSIIDKVPTAGLWIGQTDEEELGIKYDVLDPILYGLFDLKMVPEEVAKDVGVSVNVVRKVVEMVKKNEHKRCGIPAIEAP
jgi:NAD+ synthase